jgi:hypothetical protein
MLRMTSGTATVKRWEALLAALEGATSPLRFLFRATTCYDQRRRHSL